MACLTEEMKNKRERKRKSSVLIIDSDLGNMGLYKSILSTEYDLENVFELEVAKSKLKDCEYDVIILDDAFDEKELLQFIQDINKMKRGQLICLITKHMNSELAVRCICKGVKKIIEKPFTRDGLSNGIYEELKTIRDSYIKKHIVIVDEDLDNLKNMKEMLIDSYDVTIMNCAESGLKYVREYKPDLVIADASMVDRSDMNICENLLSRKESSGVTLLFMTDNPDEECVLWCAKFKPDGFLVKPIDMEHLLDNIERTFLVDAYGVRK